MGFIRFNNGDIWEDTHTENGWLFNYDEINKTFCVWENGENQVIGKEPDYVCRNLEEVYNLVKTFT